MAEFSANPVGIMKDIFNIAFFIVVGTVTILSYLHARKTFFAPLRTEVFKLQLKAIEDVLNFFQNKTDTDFLEEFDFGTILKLNVLRMTDEFAQTFFPDSFIINEAERDRLFSLVVGGVAPIEAFKQRFNRIGPRSSISELQKGDSTNRHTASHTAWKFRIYEIVEYTQKYSDRIKELDHLAASPLLPKKLRELIGGFRSIVTDNLSLIGKVVTEVSVSMPEHYLDPSTFQEFSPSWVWNEYNHKRSSLEPAAQIILESTNNYLNINKIIE